MRLKSKNRHFNGEQDAGKQPVLQSTYSHKTSEKKLQPPAISNVSRSFLNIYVIVLVVVAAVFYIGTITNGYVMDDLEMIQRNAFVTKGLAGIPDLLSTPHLKGFMTTGNETYRPLSLVMFAIEYALFGANPTWGHLINVFCYVGCVLAFFFFLKKIVEPKRLFIAFAAALIFAIHPVHTEVVANIKSRDELLCFLFAFLSLSALLRYHATGSYRYLVAGLVAYFFALLAKETAISFLLITPFVLLVFKKSNRRRAYLAVAGTYSGAVVFLLLRAAVLYHSHNVHTSVSALDNFIAGASSLPDRFATIFVVLGMYLKLALLPYPLISDYSKNTIPIANFSSTVVWVCVLFYASMVLLIIFRLRENRKDLWAMGLVLYLGNLLLFSNILFLIGSGLNERFLFFSSTGIAILVALVIERWVTGRVDVSLKPIPIYKGIALLALITIVCGKVVSARNAEWKDNTTLYTADLAKAPDNARLNYCRGYQLVSGDSDEDGTAVTPGPEGMQEGIGYLSNALRIYPGYYSARVELGTAYFKTGAFDSSLKYDLLAMQLRQDDPVVYSNLAGVYFVRKDYRTALNYCREATALNGRYASAIKNEGLCYYNLKVYDSAILCFKQAVSLGAVYKDTYPFMASAYRALGDSVTAKVYERTIK